MFRIPFDLHHRENMINHWPNECFRRKFPHETAKVQNKKEEKIETYSPRTNERTNEYQNTNRNQRIRIFQFMISQIDVMFINIWEFFDTTRAQKAFETDHTMTKQWF